MVPHDNLLLAWKKYMRASIYYGTELIEVIQGKDSTNLDQLHEKMIDASDEVTDLARKYDFQIAFNKNCKDTKESFTDEELIKLINETKI